MRMAAGDLTVGEVLSLLQGDFPEATMGWIRSLEDEHLIVPGRTPKGNRLFAPQVIDTLRWILERQREGASVTELREGLARTASAARDRAAGAESEPRLFDDPADILPPINFDEDEDEDFDEDELDVDELEVDERETSYDGALPDDVLQDDEGVDPADHGTGTGRFEFDDDEDLDDFLADEGEDGEDGDLDVGVDHDEGVYEDRDDPAQDGGDGVTSLADRREVQPGGDSAERSPSRRHPTMTHRVPMQDSGSTRHIPAPSLETLRAAADQREAAEAREPADHGESNAGADVAPPQAQRPEAVGGPRSEPATVNPAPPPRAPRPEPEPRPRDTAANPPPVERPEPAERSRPSTPERRVPSESATSNQRPGAVRPSAGGSGDNPESRRVAADAIAALQEPPSPPTPAEDRPKPARIRDLAPDISPSDLLTREEFMDEVGLDSETVGTLELFGVLSPVTVGGFYYYDDHAIRVGRVAASFAEMGLEGRHLRMYRLIAEREVALLEQLALPLLKQRNPVGREQAKATLRQASDLGGQLHAALVAEGIRDLLEGTGG